MQVGGYGVHPAAEIFPMMSGDALDALVEDVREHGQQEPVMLIRTDDGTQVLDGRNRLVACERLGIRPDTDWYKGDDPIGYVLSLNLHRRHLNESQRSIVAARLKPIYEEEARKRMLAGKPADEADDGPGTDPSEGSLRTTTVTAKEKGRAREKAAEDLNVGSTIVAKAEKALKNGVPELIKMVEDGRIRIEMAEKLAKRPEDEQRAILEHIEQKLAESPKRNAKDIIRRYDKDKVLAGIRAEPQPLPEGPFRTIVADPAWMYEKRQDDSTQRGQTDYPTMTIEEICALGEQVRNVAYVDCILWLWITNAHLVTGMQLPVLQAWGFTPKTILTWRKPKMVTGDWLRGKTEHCILAVRGNPTIDLTNQTTDFCIDGDDGYYFEAPMGEPHEKPDEFFEFVEGLCPGSKLEMFSRKDREGWQAWGAETGKLGVAATG